MGESLRSQAARGVKWTTLSSLVVALTQFVLLAVLARLLEPDDFGLVGMTMIVVGFALMFADAGTSAAVIHRQDTTRDQLSSLYWLSIVFGWLVCALLIIATPAVARFYGDPRVEPLLRLIALSFLIIPLGQQFQVLLQKHLRFDAIALAETTSTIIGAVVAVIAAARGHGAMSLVYAHLVRSTVVAVLLIALGRDLFVPRPHFRPADLKGYIGFGLYQMGEKTVGFLQSRADQLLIGRMLGATPLGFYNLAFNLINQPLSRINPVVNRVAFPVLARVQDDEARLAYGYLETRRYLALVDFPLLAGLWALAHPFVMVVYGAKWEPSVTVIQIMCFAAMMWVVGNPMGSLALARGRAGLTFRWNLARLVVMLAAVYYAAPHGIVAVSVAVLVVSVAAGIVSVFAVVRRVVNVSLKAMFVDTMLVPLVYAMTMAVLVRLITSWVDAGELARLLVGVLAGAIIYVSIVWFVERKRIREMLRLFGFARAETPR